MVVLTLDDERPALENLNKAVRAVQPDAVIHAFRDSTQALDAVRAGLRPDVAFLDIAMPIILGIDCAKEIRLCSRTTNIVFTTGFSDYMQAAFSMHASGYLLKPVTPQKIRKELENLRFPVRMTDGTVLRIVTFGTFQAYKGESVIKFKYNKTRELLAYLVDRRGEMCSNQEIAGTLWEDDNKKHLSYIQNMKSDLTHTLAACGLADSIRTRYSSIGVNPQKVDCDFYHWLNGEPQAINLYFGEYMPQYSWAESTHGYIEQRML